MREGELGVAVAVAPLETVGAHVIHDAVADFENETAGMVGSATIDETGFQKVVHGIKGVVRRLQGPLEISNGHSNLRSIVTT